MKMPVSIQVVRALLDFDAQTGTLVWSARARKHLIGRTAGKLRTDGYREIKICRRYIMAHRVAWAHHYGYWPEKQIDHRNGVRDCNSVENMRLATVAENAQNRARRSPNSSGHIGVVWNKAIQKWQAEIKVNGRPYYLGVRKDLDDACALYLNAKASLHLYCSVPR